MAGRRVSGLNMPVQCQDYRPTLSWWTAAWWNLSISLFWQWFILTPSPQGRHGSAKTEIKMDNGSKTSWQALRTSVAFQVLSGKRGSHLYLTSFGRISTIIFSVTYALYWRGSIRSVHSDERFECTYPFNIRFISTETDLRISKSTHFFVIQSVQHCPGIIGIGSFESSHVRTACIILLWLLLYLHLYLSFCGTGSTSPHAGQVWCYYGLTMPLAMCQIHEGAWCLLVLVYDNSGYRVALQNITVAWCLFFLDCNSLKLCQLNVLRPKFILRRINYLYVCIKPR